MLVLVIIYVNQITGEENESKRKNKLNKLFRANPLCKIVDLEKEDLKRNVTEKVDTVHKKTSIKPRGTQLDGDMYNFSRL